MNRIVLSLLLCFVASILLPAQNLPLSFEEEFYEPTNWWYYSNINDENNFREIRNGKLYTQQKGNQIYWTLRAIPIDSKRDFRIDMKFKAVEPMTSGMYYLIMKGADNFYGYFGINTEKKTYWIGSEQSGTWNTYNITTPEKKEPESQAIQTGLQDNQISWQVRNGEISFLINNQVTETKNFREIFGPLFTKIEYVGLATSAPMKLETDFVRVYQELNLNLFTTEQFKIKKKRLGDEINTPFVEKWPVVAPDGKTLYFVRNGDERNVAGKDNDDIWFSRAMNDSTWAPAECMPKPLNNAWPNTVMSVTPDNNTLFLMHKYLPDGSGGGAGFSITTRQGNGWAVPSDIAMTNFYNDGKTNEFYLSADRLVMLMGVQRKDSYGGNDLYVSLLQPDGSYSEPRNMGPVINSAGTEISPFLAADGRTLYFGSDGHPGFGSSDIFVSKRLDDTWTNWSKPQNLGAQINSSNWEAYFTLPASGAYAYVASNLVGSLDLYRIDLPPSLRPEPVVIISGKVIDTKTKQPVDAAILYNDILNNSNPGRALANPGDGMYKIALPAGKNYAFLAQKEGYYAIAENIDLTKLSSYNEIHKDLFVTPLETGQTIRLNNIFFDFNKAELKQESFQELDRVITLLNANPQMIIEVGGHTDNVGDDAYNLKLSQQRADAVVKYLLSKAVPSTRVSSKGYGETKPVAKNDTDANKATNRRVEFMILKK